MPQQSTPKQRLAGLASLSLCLAAALSGCAQGGRSTLGGPADPTLREEEQRARGSMHPMPPGQNMPGGGDAAGSGGSGGGAAEGDARSSGPGQ
ncbi:MAG: hypothetical protein ACOVK6_04620 [Ramlibacter sp.]|jgi:hypothetical protein